MPALTNRRQELFAQFVARGIVPLRAYPMSGYKAHHAEPYRVRGYPCVKARIAELMAPVTRKTRVTLDSLVAELDEARAQAQATGNAAAMVAAVVGKAKLLGLMVKRTEVGKPGEHGLTREQALQAIRAKHGDDVADLLAQALDKA
jgi:phage terminase small subunit